jgi:hypothetical protein
MLCVGPCWGWGVLVLLLPIPEMIIEWKLGKMLVRDASTPLISSNVDG